MTQEEIQKEKELLLNVLKDGLPHGLQLQITDVNEFTFNGELRVLSKNWCRINIANPVKRGKVKNQTIPLNYIYIKPYLRSMSNMTEEEKKEYYNLCIEEEREELEFGEWVTRVYYHNTIESIDWLNKNHFDYRGLIEKGLAIDATNLNIYRL